MDSSSNQHESSKKREMRTSLASSLQLACKTVAILCVVSGVLLLRYFPFLISKQFLPVIIMSGSAPVDNKENPSSDTDTLQVWTWSAIEQAIDQQVTRDKAATERIEGLTQRLQLVQESFRERFGGSAENSERGGASQSQGRSGKLGIPGFKGATRFPFF